MFDHWMWCWLGFGCSTNSEQTRDSLVAVFTVVNLKPFAKSNIPRTNGRGSGCIDDASSVSTCGSVTNKASIQSWGSMLAFNWFSLSLYFAPPRLGMSFPIPNAFLSFALFSYFVLTKKSFIAQ